jgi:hypothetical protein
MWMIARYLPVAPFSLKPAAVTSSGGKTLLVATPYAIKMALLDVALRTLGFAHGEELFPHLRDLRVAIAPPKDILVFKTFGKIWRPVESKESKKSDETQEEFEARMREKLVEKMERGQYPFYSTISFREYVYYRDPFWLALAPPDMKDVPKELAMLLCGINYLGKRGGFLQIMEPPQVAEHLDERLFIDLTGNGMRAFPVAGTLQVLDDCGESLTFSRANIYNHERISAGKERIFHHIVLPYHLIRSSRGYSWYQRMKEDQRAEGGEK